MTTESESLKINKLKLFLYSFFNLFVIFRIDFLVLPYYLYLFAMIGLVVSVLQFKLLSDGNITRTAILYVFLFFIAFLSYGLNLSNDFSYINRLISVVYKLGLGAFSIYLFTIIFGKQATIDNFITSFSISCLLLLISSIVLIIFSGFSDFWIGTIVSRNKLLDEGYFFRKSIAGYTGFDELSVYCVSYFCCAKMIADKMNSGKRVFKLWLLYFILVFGGLIYGRTAIISAIFSVILLFVSVSNKTELIKELFILMLLAVFVFLLLYFVSLGNKEVSSWFNWAFEPIFAFFSHGDVASMNSLKNMVKLPNAKQLVFGDGLYVTSTGYYMGTDIGYLRDIYYFGIFGLSCIYLFIVSLLRSIYKNTRVRSHGLLLMFIFLDIIVLEMKGCMWDGSVIYLSMFYFVSKYECETLHSKDSKIKNAICTNQ